MMRHLTMFLWKNPTFFSFGCGSTFEYAFEMTTDLVPYTGQPQNWLQELILKIVIKRSRWRAGDESFDNFFVGKNATFFSFESVSTFEYAFEMTTNSVPYTG